MRLPSCHLAPLAFAAILTCLTSAASAQLDIGLITGGSAYDGELAPVDRIRHFEEARLALGAFGRYEFSPYTAVRLGYTYLSIGGADSTRSTSANRNHRFITDIHELAASLEYYPLGTDRRLAPYVSLGAGAFHYNPTTDFRGDRYDLRPLRTEGQGSPGFEAPYEEWAFVLPFGAGLRYAVLPRLAVGLEVVARFTTVDHLDDFSRRFYVPLEDLERLADNGDPGDLTVELSYRTDELNPSLRPDEATLRANPESDDYYLTANLTLSYRFGKPMSFGKRLGQSGRPIQCPKF